MLAFLRYLMLQSAVMDLEKAISDFKLRIAESPRDSSEADTKATLIEPMLVALGWNTADVREVKREGNNPIFIALGMVRDL